MKVHGLAKNNKTICGDEATPDLKFWISTLPSEVTCTKCLHSMSKDEITGGETEHITKKRCKKTQDFMYNATRYLQSKGYTRKEILIKLELPHSSFVYLNQGRVRISLKEAYRIADTLGLSLDYLSGRVDLEGNVLN